MRVLGQGVDVGVKEGVNVGAGDGICVGEGAGVAAGTTFTHVGAKINVNSARATMILVFMLLLLLRFVVRPHAAHLNLLPPPHRHRREVPILPLPPHSADRIGPEED